MVEYKSKLTRVVELSDDLPRAVLDSIIDPKVKAHLDIMPRPKYPTE